MQSSTKPRAWLWLAVLTPLAAVGTAGLLVGLGLVFNASGESEPLTAYERALLLDIEHLCGWLKNFEPDISRERATKTRYFDDSYELEYIYDVPAENAPYLSYSITFEGSETDARTTYASFWGGTHIGLFVGEGELGFRETNELFSWGDESKFGTLTLDGRPFGNVFLARDGDKVVYFLVSGIYFDEQMWVEAVLLPYLDRL
jgi:hypothetical protein